MAIWPFRRKGKRSRSRAGDHSTGATVDPSPQPEITSSQGQDPGPPAETSHPEHDDSPGKSQRKIVKRRKQDPEPNSNKRSVSRQSQINNHNNNTNRNNPNHHPSSASPPPRAQTSPPPASTNPIQIPPLRGQTSNDPFTSNNNDPDAFVPYHFQNHTSYSSLGHENFSTSHRPPTLHTKPSVAESGILRRKSSKRKTDHAREQEIKAMGGPIRFHKRPATFTQGQQQRWEASGGPSALSKHASDRPQSDLSLPNHDSLESSMSDNSDSYAFKVNAFDALTPRPLIRYAESPRYMLSRSLDPSRSSNRKDKRPMIPEEDSRRRMDELADDLDAGALRELMERDQRRREQKRATDQEKLQRRLQRRADRQREEERRRARKAEKGEKEDTKPEEKQKKQVQADGVDGAGIAAAGASGARDGSSSYLPDASKENLPHDDDRHSTGDTPPKPRETSPTQGGQNLRHSIAVSQDVPKFQVGGSPAVSVMDYRAGSTSTPQLHPHRESVSDVSRSLEPEKNTSVKPMSSWTSFFRRGGSSLRKSSVDRSRKGPPSEFSNTSRESFSKSQPSTVPPPPIPERSFLRSGTSVNRTQSKFTEHLHDFPLSPPDSRLHSPEVPDTTKNATSSANRMDSDSDKFNTAGGSAVTAPVPVPKRNEDRHLSWEANTPETGPGSAFLSQSLASVDSEGSWLSGKPLRRTSHPLNHPMRSSAPSSKDRLDEYAEEKKAKDNTGDDYYSKMTPDPEGEESTHNRKTSSGQNTTDSDRESDILPMHMPPEEEHRTFHQTVAAKNPIVVHPVTSRPKSKEGLLNQFKSGEAELADPEEESPIDNEVVPEVHRATSVDLGKRHVRHISAGSAKLLDIPRRDSVDSKGQSGAVGSVGGDANTVQE